MENRPKDIWVFLDNAAAITRLKDIHPGPGQQHATHTHRIASELAEWGITLHIHWVPGHMNVEGNEAADKLAKAGAQKPSPTHPTTTVSWLKRQARSQLLKDWTNLWKNDSRRHGTQYHGQPKLKMDDHYYHTARKTTSSLVQLRTGHGPFRSYLYRIKAPHIDSPNCYCSPAIQTPAHLILKCHTYAAHRRKLRFTPRNITTALHTKWGIDRTLPFLIHTGIGLKRWLREDRGQVEDEEDRRWWGRGVGQGRLEDEVEEDEAEAAGGREDWDRGGG